MRNDKQTKSKLYFRGAQGLNFHRLLLLLVGLVGLIVVVIYQIRALYSQSSNGYMPVVKARIIAETEKPLCRWPHTINTTTYLYYKWGDRLQTPNSLYRNAFEASIGDWNIMLTFIRFSYSASGNITLNTYSQDDGAGGYAQPYCSGTTTTNYDVFANIFYESPSTTANYRRSVTGHELGHGISLGHIPGRDFISLMGYNPNGDIYYIPQAADIDFVNQFYP